MHDVVDVAYTVQALELTNTNVQTSSGICRVTIKLYCANGVTSMMGRDFDTPCGCFG